MTYFDRHYLPKGLALYESLVRHSPPFVFWILCLDEETHRVLTNLRLEHARLVPVAELEAADPELLAVKASRLPVEYYWTCGPAFLLYAFDQDREAETVTYLDADVFCFSSPAALSEELDGHALLLSPHGGTSKLSDDTRQAGLFNVGLIGIRRTPDALACVRRWREQCLEWCFDKFENGKFGDQAYLDEWPDRVADTAILRHEGAGVAPWNVLDRPLRFAEGRVMVGRDPLVFFHFGRLRRINRWLYEMHDWRFHRHKIDPVLRRHIYAPYVQWLQSAERQILASGGRLYPGSAGRGPENQAVRKALARHDRLSVIHRMRRFLIVTRWFVV